MSIQTGALLAMLITAIAGVALARIAFRSKRDEEKQANDQTTHSHP